MPCPYASKAGHFMIPGEDGGGFSKTKLYKLTLATFGHGQLSDGVKVATNSGSQSSCCR